MAKVFFWKVISANLKYVLMPPGTSFSKLDNLLFYIDVKSAHLSVIRKSKIKSLAKEVLGKCSKSVSKKVIWIITQWRHLSESNVSIKWSAEKFNFVLSYFIPKTLRQTPTKYFQITADLVTMENFIFCTVNLPKTPSPLPIPSKEKHRIVKNILTQSKKL